MDESVRAVDYFRMILDKTSSARSSASIKQALMAFEKYSDVRDICFADLTESFISGWATWLFSQNYKVSTVRYYLKILSALYGKAVKDGVAQETDAFTNILKKISEINEEYVPDSEILEQRLKTLVDWSENSKGGIEQLGVDMAVFGIFAGGLTLDEIARYKNGDYNGDIPILKIIVERYYQSRNTYLFPLRQSFRTPKQLSRTVEKAMAMAFNRVKLEISVDNRICSRIWSYLAIWECGVSPSEAAMCLSSEAQNINVFLFTTPADKNEDKKNELIHRVYETVCDAKPQWFALRMRPNSRFNALSQKIDALSPTLRPEIYYPNEEIAKKVKNKIVIQQKPVIPGLVFYRTRLSNVKKLMSCVGDLCWTYRTSDGYTIIPDNQMREFKTALGTITPSTEIYPEGTITLNPGDRVTILSGSLIGREGVISEIRRNTSKESEGRTIYRLSIPNESGIEWIVDAERTRFQKD